MMSNNVAVPKLRFTEFRYAEGWKEKKLKSLGKLVPGLTYQPSDVRSEGLLVLRSSNIQTGMIDLEDKVFVRPDVKGAHLSRPDDILICVRNGSKPLIGKNALIPEALPLCTHGAFMTVFRSTEPKFTFQLFQTDAYRNQVVADLGATINSINGGNLLNYRFYVPETPEQQKIADCLTSVDDLMTAEAQKLKALKDHKKGLMQQLFPREGETTPRLRFPEFRDAGDWDPIEIGDIGPASMCKRVMKSETASSGDIPFFKIGTFGKEPDAYIGRDLYEDYKARFSFPKVGDILISASGTIGRLVVFDGSPSYFQDSNIVWIDNDESLVCNPFLLRCYETTTWRTEGNTIARLYNNNLMGIKVIIPKLDEQRKISDLLASVDDLITAEAQKLEALKDHKKGLMQQLFPASDEVNA